MVVNLSWLTPQCRHGAQEAEPVDQQHSPHEEQVAEARFSVHEEEADEKRRGEGDGVEVGLFGIAPAPAKTVSAVASMME